MTRKIIFNHQKLFAEKFPAGAIAYRAIRVPNGFGEIRSSWKSFTNNSRTGGNKGQMAIISGSMRGRNCQRVISHVLGYATRPSVQASTQLFPDGKFKFNDQIVVMSFRIYSHHLLSIPSTYMTGNREYVDSIEHIVLRDDLDLRKLPEYREERMSLHAALSKSKQWYSNSFCL